MVEWFGTLPAWTKLIGLVGMLTTAGVALNGRIDAVEDAAAIVAPLPARVDGLENRVDAVQHSIDDVDGKVGLLLCHAEAERAERSYESCVDEL